MDKKDEKILECLNKDSRQSIQQISKKTKIPITTIHNRMKKLEETGVIKKYTIDLDNVSLGFPISTLVLVNFMDSKKKDMELTKKNIAFISKDPRVEQISVVAGDADMVLRVRTASVKDLHDFLVESPLSELNVKTKTMLILREF